MCQNCKWNNTHLYLTGCYWTVTCATSIFKAHSGSAGYSVYLVVEVNDYSSGVIWHSIWKLFCCTVHTSQILGFQIHIFVTDICKLLWCDWSWGFRLTRELYVWMTFFLSYFHFMLSKRILLLSHLYIKSHISFSCAAWVIMVKETVKWNVHIAVPLFLLLQSMNIMLKIKLHVYIYNVIVIEYRKLKGIRFCLPLMVYVHIKCCEN